MKVGAAIKLGKLNDPDPEKRGAVGIVEMDDPVVTQNDILIKVAYCSICGSDPHLTDGTFGTNFPNYIGHEVSGVVAELGEYATVKGLKVGDRVSGNFRHTCGVCYYCQMGQPHFCVGRVGPGRRSPGMAPYMVWNQSQVFKLPDNVSLAKGCLLEPLSVAVRAGDKVHNYVGARVAISGGGPIGQLALQVMKLQGATMLTMIEPIADRRDLAVRFGAQNTIDPVNQDVVEEAKRITDGLGYDVIIDVSGAAAACRPLLDAAARGGTILYGAMYPQGYEMPLDMLSYMYRKDLTLTGMFLSPNTFPRSVQLLEHLDLDPFIEARYPLDQIVEAFDMHMSGKYPKVIVNCNEDLKDL